MKLSDIVIGERHRKELGDIEGLARSLDEIDLQDFNSNRDLHSHGDLLRLNSRDCYGHLHSLYHGHGDGPLDLSDLDDGCCLGTGDAAECESYGEDSSHQIFCLSVY